MALNTYQALLDSIPAWLHRTGDSLVMAVVPDMVALAESEIYANLRTRYQEQAFNIAAVGGSATIPSDYLDLKYAYIDGTPVTNLTRKSPDWILSQYSQRSACSRPEFIARDFASFIFGPFPDTDYTVKGVYYKEMPSLSLLNPSNKLLTRYPKAFLFGTLSQAEKFIRNDPNVDQMMVVWKGEFAQALGEAQGESDREAMSGGRARISVVGSTP